MRRRQFITLLSGSACSCFIFAGAASLLLLNGCAELEAQKQQQKMQNALSQWIGRSIADYVAVKGAPQLDFDVGKGKKSFQWVLTGQAPAAGAVLSSGIVVARPAQTLTCRVTFTAVAEKPAPTFADWRIETYQWGGDC
jgi:hypothetical protein